MAKSKPVQARFSELTPGQLGDFFALLAEKNQGRHARGQAVLRLPFPRRPPHRRLHGLGRRSVVRGRARTTGRPASSTSSAPSTANTNATARRSPNSTPSARPTDADQADGFDPSQLVESSRYDPAAMFAELKELATAHIADEPLRRLVLTLLDKYAEPLQRLPATRDRFHPFAGGLLEHTLSVTRSAVQLAERYAAHYTELKPPLNRDLVAAGAILHDIGRVLEFGDEAYGAVRSRCRAGWPAICSSAATWCATRPANWAT